MSIENEPRDIEDTAPEGQESDGFSEFEILEEPEKIEPAQEKTVNFEEYKDRLKLIGENAEKQEEQKKSEIDKKERGPFNKLKKGFSYIGGVGALSAALLSGCSAQGPEAKEAVAKKIEAQQKTADLQTVRAESLEVTMEREKQYLVALQHSGEKDKIKATEQRIQELKRRIKEMRGLFDKKEEKPSIIMRPWSAEEFGTWGFGKKTAEKPAEKPDQQAELSRINELMPEAIRTEAKDILDYLVISRAITSKGALTSRVTQRGFLFNLGRFGIYEAPQDKIKNIVGARELINMAAKKASSADAPVLASRLKIENSIPNYIMMAIAENGNRIPVKGITVTSVPELKPEEERMALGILLELEKRNYVEEVLPSEIPGLKISSEGLIKYKINFGREEYRTDKRELLKLIPHIIGIKKENERLEQLYASRAQQSFQRESVQSNRELIKQQTKNQIMQAIKGLEKR